jgi:hypothetical protein
MRISYRSPRHRHSCEARHDVRAAAAAADAIVLAGVICPYLRLAVFICAICG